MTNVIIYDNITPYQFNHLKLISVANVTEGVKHISTISLLVSSD